ncbi:arad-like aldolase/epimerase [Coniochaeta ligniaria NRRL 30616]|uniref:Arad-like aldolase/epimerase n=1 Tax=Coniochaeta ligniaria NRRL 30616 TaxID=1408157 RepID=A0A1J7IN12_9PEZI|nr:arad-like aldolase/epimerase [Coniochaeta ligniaria NRRL 30616]
MKTSITITTLILLTSVPLTSGHSPLSNTNLSSHTPHTMSPQDPHPAIIQCSIRNFITASHILHHHAVLDAYGHLSFRHPFSPTTFFMSRNIAPATISSPDDLIEYHITDASPVDPSAAANKGYAERHIHSEIHKRHPSVRAAVHSHSEAVVPYSVSGVPLRPVYHMAGFLRASGAPVFEISEHWREGDVKDMLVRNEWLGAAHAAHFDDGVAVVLMRGHGFTAVGGSVEEVVLRAVYTAKNAAIQTGALTMRGAAAFLAGGGQVSTSGAASDGIRYLSQEEAEAATEMTRWSALRPWGLWVREVEACGLYVNGA